MYMCVHIYVCVHTHTYIRTCTATVRWSSGQHPLYQHPDRSVYVYVIKKTKLPFSCCSPSFRVQNSRHLKGLKRDKQQCFVLEDEQNAESCLDSVSVLIKCWPLA